MWHIVDQPAEQFKFFGNLNFKLARGLPWLPVGLASLSDKATVQATSTKRMLSIGRDQYNMIFVFGSANISNIRA